MSMAPSTVPARPLTAEIVHEFAIRTDRGLWSFSHQEGEHFYFERAGSRTRWGFSEAQLLRIMQQRVDGHMFSGEFLSARPSWHKREARLREASLAALRRELQDEQHPHAALITRLMELFRANADDRLREHCRDDAKLRQQTIAMLAAWLSPAVTTEWLFTNGPLNNMCATWRKVFGIVAGVKITRSATNKALIAAFDPVRHNDREAVNAASNA